MTDFWVSVAMTAGILAGAGFVIGLMVATTGVAKKDPPRRGSGMVEM